MEKTYLYDREEIVLFEGREQRVEDVLDQLRKRHGPTPDKPGHIAMVEEEAITSISEVNRLRCADLEGSIAWSVQDHGCALGGEVGELLDILKKLKRHDVGIADQFPTMRSREELIADAADEVGDIMTYLDLVCEQLGIDIVQAWAAKFNKVSHKLNRPYHILIQPKPADEVVHEEPMDIEKLLARFLQG